MNLTLVPTLPAAAAHGKATAADATASAQGFGALVAEALAAAVAPAAPPVVPPAVPPVVPVPPDGEAVPGLPVDGEAEDSTEPGDEAAGTGTGATTPPVAALLALLPAAPAALAAVLHRVSGGGTQPAADTPPGADVAATAGHRATDPVAGDLPVAQVTGDTTGDTTGGADERAPRGGSGSAAPAALAAVAPAADTNTSAVEATAGTPATAQAPLPPTSPSGAPPVGLAVDLAAPAALRPTDASPDAAPTGPVARQVFPEVTRLATLGDGAHRVTLHLRPEGLGQVRVTLTLREGQVNVTMTAAHTAGKALAADLPELHRLLAASGATESQVTIREAVPAAQLLGTDTGSRHLTSSGSSSGDPTYAGDTSGRPGADSTGREAAHAHQQDGRQQRAGTPADHLATDGARERAAMSGPSNPVTRSRAAGLDVTI